MNKFIKSFVIADIVASCFVFLHMLILASLNNWVITLDFNSLGEGWLELIFASLLFPFVIWYFIEDIKSW